VAAAHGELALRAVAYVAREPGDKKLKVVVLCEPADLSIPLASVSAGMFDEKGKLSVQWTAQPDDLKRLPVMAGFTARAGAYRLRVAAVDAAGRRGTVDQDLSVELTQAGPVTLSALVLGTAVRGAFSPRLLYINEQSAVGYLEVYGVTKGATVTVDFELASSRQGPALIAVPVALRPGDAEDRVILGQVPIGNVPPGDYLLRATVSINGERTGQVMRTLRKAGR
jgi:hypothetical protein